MSQARRRNESDVSDSGVPRVRAYMDLYQLAAHTGFSVSTINRLRRKGKIPYHQPGGPGTKIVFPHDAIERVYEPSGEVVITSPTSAAGSQRGPKPKWLKNLPDS